MKRDTSFSIASGRMGNRQRPASSSTDLESDNRNGQLSSHRAPLRRLIVATFNVRSLKRAKLHQLTAGCKRHNIDIVVIQEHRGRVSGDIEVR